MRISFPNGEHADVAIGGMPLSLGAVAGNDVVVAASGVAPRHATISQDPRRGILLKVTQGAAVHVNGRRVREFAMLRLGDVVSLGHLTLLLKPERDASIVVEVPEQGAIAQPDPAARAAASRVVLRGVAGGFHGRSLALQSKVVIGRGKQASIRIDDPDLPEQAASFEVVGDRVVMRDLGTADGLVVNGVVVRSAQLHPGDQIAIETHRFVLEAPGLPPRGSGVEAALPPGARAGSTQTLRAVQAAPAAGRAPAAGQPNQDAPTAPPRGRLLWLLLAASIIAAALAGLFLLGPR